MNTPQNIVEQAQRLEALGHRLTHKDTLGMVRSLGMSPACFDGEYRVTYRAADMPSGERREAVACYTTDRLDAVLTAAAMRAALDLGHVR